MRWALLSAVKSASHNLAWEFWAPISPVIVAWGPSCRAHKLWDCIHRRRIDWRVARLRQEPFKTSCAQRRFRVFLHARRRQAAAPGLAVFEMETISSHCLRHVGRGKACDCRCHSVELLSAAAWFSQTHTSIVVLSFGCAANCLLPFLSPSASHCLLPRDPGQEPKLLDTKHQAIRSHVS
jgi:hypothetical protein